MRGSQSIGKQACTHYGGERRGLGSAAATGFSWCTRTWSRSDQQQRPPCRRRHMRRRRRRRRSPPQPPLRCHRRRPLSHLAQPFSQHKSTQRRWPAAACLRPAGHGWQAHAVQGGHRLGGQQASGGGKLLLGCTCGGCTCGSSAGGFGVGLGVASNSIRAAGSTPWLLPVGKRCFQRLHCHQTCRPARSLAVRHHSLLSCLCFMHLDIDHFLPMLIFTSLPRWPPWWWTRLRRARCASRSWPPRCATQVGGQGLLGGPAGPWLAKKNAYAAEGWPVLEGTARCISLQGASYRAPRQCYFDAARLSLNEWLGKNTLLALAWSWLQMRTRWMGWTPRACSPGEATGRG